MNATLSELTVVLATDSEFPSILNPDFLRLSGIVEPSWQVKNQPDAILSVPGFAQVLYENGVSIRIEPNRVILAQQYNQLEIENIVCIQMAKRFLNVTTFMRYISMGINPRGHIVVNPEIRSRVADVLEDRGARMELEGARLEFKVNLKYVFTDKQVNVDIVDDKIRDEDNNETEILRFLANIHRDIVPSTPGEINTNLLSLLDGWKDDLETYNKIIGQLSRLEISGICNFNT